MPELADSLAVGASPAAGGPASPDRNGDGGASRRRPDAEARIAELSREKKEFKSLVQQQRDEIQALKEQFAEIRGQMTASSGSQQGPLRSWDQVKDLPGALKMALDPESPNPDAVYNVFDEMVRRKFDSFREEVLSQGRSEYQQANNARQVEAEILSRFGNDARDQDSPLFQRASAYAASFQQKYGRDILERQPDLMYDAFARAQLDLTGDQSDRIRELETALERARAEASMEPGSQSVAQPNDAVREALQARDPRAAIRNLGIAQSFARR